MTEKVTELLKKKNLDAIHGVWNPDIVKGGIPNHAMLGFVKGENKDD